MASIRNLKKKINYMIYDVVDECFSLQLYDKSKTEVTDQFIDEIADFQEEIMSEIKRAKSKENFKAIEEKLQKANDDWKKRLNSL